MESLKCEFADTRNTHTHTHTHTMNHQPEIRCNYIVDVRDLFFTGEGEDDGLGRSSKECRDILLAASFKFSGLKTRWLASVGHAAVIENAFSPAPTGL